MFLSEVEAKDVLRQYGIKIPDGVLFGPSDTPAVPTGKGPWFVKAQVRRGGRGKAGLVTKIRDRDLAQVEVAHVGAMAGGVPVLVEAAVPGVERYVAIGMDAAACAPVLVLGSCGGIDIEEAESSTLSRLQIDMSRGVLPHDGIRLAKALGWTSDELKRVGGVCTSLWQAFLAAEAQLVEVNPCIWTGSDFVAADAKVLTYAGDITDGLVFFEREGRVAVLSAGAGLGMAIGDALTAAGPGPANFADVAGGVSDERVTALATRVAERAQAEQVRAMLIVFSLSHTPLERVLRPLLEALSRVAVDVPTVAFLSGAIPGDAQEAARLTRALEAMGIEMAETAQAAVQRATVLGAVEA